MHRTLPVRTLVGAVALVALTACGGGDPVSTGAGDDASRPAPVTTTPSTQASDASVAAGSADAGESEAVAEVPEVLAFTAPTVDGGTFDGASLAGKDALLWFRAPWCPVCQREAPVVAGLAEEYSGRVQVVGVGGLSGDLEAMRGFVERGGVEGLTHVADTDGAVYTRFGVTSQYDVGVLDESGEVRVVTGPLSEAKLRAELDALVGG